MFGGAPPIAANDEAITIASRLRIVIFTHLTIAILEFFTSSWFSGVLNIAFCLLGYFSIRHADSYRISYLRCYYWWCLWSAGFGFLFLILYYAGVWEIDEGWQRTTFEIVSYISIAIESLGFYFGRKLHNVLVELLRNQMEAMVGAAMAAGGVATAHPVGGPQEGYPHGGYAGQGYPAQAYPMQGQQGPVVEAIPVAGPGAAPAVAVRQGSSIQTGNAPQHFEGNAHRL